MTGAYKVVVAPGVQAALGHFDRALQHRMAVKIDAASVDPFAVAAAVAGTDLRTIHIGDWRLIYRVDKAEHTVRVLAVRPLRPPTRGMP